MLNPFIFPPRQIPDVASARQVLGFYDHDIAGAVAQAEGLRDKLNAILGVLKQAHPDLSDDLDLLVEAAINVGHLQGTREDSDIVKSQFRTSLPNAIRKALDTPSQ
jgi:hypothetical protein